MATHQRIYINKQRVIDKQFIKGYCDKHGQTKDIPRLSTLEPFVIIERFNSVIRDFANFSTEFLSNPVEINRWIWVLKYSCLKTLYKKYKLSLSKLIKKYYYKNKEYTKQFGKTVSFKVRMKYEEEILEKEWILLNYLKAKHSTLALIKKLALKTNFWILDNRKNRLTLE
jgi:hypothetical protein